MAISIRYWKKFVLITQIWTNFYQLGYILRPYSILLFVIIETRRKIREMHV